MAVTPNSSIHIDGSKGEGGGPILRTALALSIVIGKSIHIKNIRAGRAKPGLLRQHLAAVRAAAEICGGEIDGAVMGSQELRFAPGSVKSGEYTFAVGSAGSTTLVLQTVLAPLLTAAGSSTIILEGGTHNPYAPPFDFFEQAFLPLVCRMGPRITATLDRHGFYPRGADATQPGSIQRQHSNRSHSWNGARSDNAMRPRSYPDCRAVLATANWRSFPRNWVGRLNPCTSAIWRLGTVRATS